MYYNPCDVRNYSATNRGKEKIRFIVVHYTANNGDTARNNVDYFARAQVGASAHYFVDEKEVASSVPWYHVAWHCGGKKLIIEAAFHGVCTNSNSIGIEMCSRKWKDGTYYFHEKTLENAAAFVAELMKTYNVPIDRVIRHYDVTGKICPAPLVDETQWAKFKDMAQRAYSGEVVENPVETVETVYFEKIDQIPAGELRDTVAELVEKGIVRGTGTGLHLTYDMVRNLVFCKRMIDQK